MAIGYTELDFINGTAPALNAANMNHIDEGVKACADALDLETVAGKAMTQAANAAAQRTLLNIEDGADVTDEANVTAIENATAEVTAAPAHWNVLVAGAKKRLTHAGFATIVKAFFGFVANAVGFEMAGGTTSKKLTVDADASTSNIPTLAGKTAADAIGAATGATTAIKLANLTSPATTAQRGVALLAADGGTTAGTAVQGNDARLSVVSTWTPALKINDSTTGIVQAATVGISIKRGREITLMFDITLSNKGLETSYVSLTGVPVPAAYTLFGNVQPYANFTGLIAGCSIGLNVASSTIFVFVNTTTGYVALSGSQLTDTSRIRGSVTYITA